MILVAESLGRMADSGSSALPSEFHPTLSGLTGLLDATVGQLGRLAAKIGRERRENVLPLLRLREATAADLRRLPLEGPDLFAGHFGEVVARQASHQDALRKTQKLLDRSRPAGPLQRASRGRSPRGGKRPRKAQPTSQAQSPSTGVPGQVTVRGGKRTFTPGAASAPKPAKRRF